MRGHLYLYKGGVCFCTKNRHVHSVLFVPLHSACGERGVPFLCAMYEKQGGYKILNKKDVMYRVLFYVNSDAQFACT